MSDHERIYLIIEIKISNFNIFYISLIKEMLFRILILIHMKLIGTCIFQNNLVKIKTRFDNLILINFKNNVFTNWLTSIVFFYKFVLFQIENLSKSTTHENVSL